MIKRLFVIAVCLLSIFAVSQPSAASPAHQPDRQPSRQQKKLRVALVLPGSISDKGFNESAYNGLKMLKEQLGVETTFSESTPSANFERVFRGFADDGNDIIIGHGFEFGDVAAKVSKDYPKQYFIVTNRPGISGPNLAGISPNGRDSAFLVGVLAGLTTKSNKIGVVIGFDFPTLIAQTEAFRLGVKSVNPKAELSVSYIGTFDDPAKGKEAALAQISAGADLIYQSADSAGVGALQAAEEKGVKAIGWGVDQYSVAPKTVIATQVVDTAAMMVQEVKLIMDGKFEGKTIDFGLDTGVVGVSDYHGLVPPEIGAQVEAWRQAIMSGALTVPFLTDKDAATKLDPLKLPPPGASPTSVATMSATLSATMRVTMSATAAK